MRERNNEDQDHDQEWKAAADDAYRRQFRSPPAVSQVLLVLDG